MRRRRDRLTNFQAGLLAIGLILAASYLGYTKGHVPFLEHHYQVQATFGTAATRLATGSPVRIAGVQVGKVTKVGRGPGGTARVTMRIDDRGRPIHADATMKIRPRLFLEGNFFVDIKPGTPQAPEIPDGGMVPIAQTSVPVQFDQVLNILTSDVRGDLQQTVKGLATALDGGAAQSLNHSFPQWGPGFRNLAVVAQAARGPQPGDLTSFVQSAGRVANAVAQREGDLRGLVTNFARTSRTFAASSNDLKRSITALDGTLRTAPPALREISRALPSVDRFARGLEPALRAAPQAITTLRPFVRDAGRLVAAPRLPALTASLRAPIRQLSDLTPSLQGLLAELEPVAACITNNVTPTLNAKVDDGKLTTGQPIWQELVHFPIGLATAAGSFDGNGHSIRDIGGASEDSLATQQLITDNAVVDNVATLASVQLLGARPRWEPESEPPFKPDVPCSGQPLGSFAASTVRIPRAASTRAVPLSPAAATNAIKAALTQRQQPSFLQNLRAKLTSLGKAGKGR